MMLWIIKYKIAKVGVTASYYYIFRSEYNVQFICHNHILERYWKWKCYMTGCDGTVISDCSVV